MATRRRARFVLLGEIRKLMATGFIFVKQSCMLDSTKKSSIAFGHTGENDACSREAASRQVQMQAYIELEAASAGCSKTIAKTYLRFGGEDPAPSKKIPVTSLRALPE